MTPEYQTWVGIIQRTTNPRAAAWANYGGRGITVCPAWRHSFPAFLAHVGRRPSPAHSIDRIDDRGYEPGNVRWATAAEQNRNRRRSRDVRRRIGLALLEWAHRRDAGGTSSRPTYRAVAAVAGCSPSSAWRHANRGRDVTHTEAERDLRFAMVLASRGQGTSIRRIASELAISRSAVERDLRLARRLAEQGFDVVELARRALIAAQAEPSEGRR